MKSLFLKSLLFAVIFGTSFLVSAGKAHAGTCVIQGQTYYRTTGRTNTSFNNVTYQSSSAACVNWGASYVGLNLPYYLGAWYNVYYNGIYITSGYQYL